jgi:hypothetical protein
MKEAMCYGPLHPRADPARILEILLAAGIVRPEQIAEAAAFIERLHHAA